MKLLFVLVAIAGCIVMGSPAAADSLYGTQVTLTADYPTLGNAASDSVTRTAGAGIEFPSGTLVNTATGLFLIGVNIDVGVSTIDLTYIQNAQALNGTFNGYVFDFGGATITDASLDPLSTFSSQQVGIGFGPHDVTVNGEGLFFSTSSHILVDLNATVNPSTSSVPEPQSYALLVAGLGLAGFLCRLRGLESRRRAMSRNRS